jgi:hypothetical protein
VLFPDRLWVSHTEYWRHECSIIDLITSGLMLVGFVEQAWSCLPQCGKWREKPLSYVLKYIKLVPNWNYFLLFAIISRKNLPRLFLTQCLVHLRDCKKYKTIILLFSDPLLCIISNGTDFYCIKFASYDVKISHTCHVCGFNTFHTERVGLFIYSHTTFNTH